MDKINQRKQLQRKEDVRVLVSNSIISRRLRALFVKDEVVGPISQGRGTEGHGGACSLGRLSLLTCRVAEKWTENSELYEPKDTVIPIRM